MIDKSRVLKLLGSGLSSEIVATTVGCEAAYISQLLADENFRAQVTALRIEALTANSQRDKAIDEIEDILIRKLKENLDYVVSNKDIYNAFVIINHAKRRGIAAAESTVINNTVVNLEIPPAVLHRYVTSPRGEVVEVEGQTLVTVSPQELLKQAKQRAEAAKSDEKRRSLTYSGVATTAPATG
jgi:hypothetical protein